MRRRGLRLNWRALALLGALLAMTIEWSGLVHGMPATLPPAAASAQSGARPTTPANLSQAISGLGPAAQAAQEKGNRTGPNCTGAGSGSGDGATDDGGAERTLCEVAVSEVREERKEQKSSNGGDSDDDRRSHSSGGGPRSDFNQMHSAGRVGATAPDKREEDGGDHSARANSSDVVDGSRLPATVTSSSAVQLQRIKISNLISNKRKRKKITDHDGDGAATGTEGGDATVGCSHSNYSISSSGVSDSNRQRSPEDHTPSSTHTPPDDRSSTTLAPQVEDVTRSSAPTADGDQDESSGGGLSFTFSSSHHIAILSRTERSIRASRNRVGPVRRSPDADGDTRVVTKSRRLNNSRNTSTNFNSQPTTSTIANGNANSSKHLPSNLDRNERSTIAHLSGPSRKIQLYIKNRFIQLLPDGTVNGTQDDQSEYTILQRSTIDVGRIKIQGVGTCLYLCMDQCGSVYGSKDFSDDCVFNENMEQHNYNTYSSTYNSNARRIYYLALNRHGEPRRLQIPPTRSLGKLATYTNAITETVPQERVERLIAKNFGANRIKHGLRQLCDTGKPLIELIDGRHFKARPKCNPNPNTSNISQSQINSNSNSNMNSNSNNNNNSRFSGQLLKNVPAAKKEADNLRNSEKASSSISISISNSSATTANSSSSGSSNRSPSSSQSNNGHISDRSNSSSSSLDSSSVSSSHRGLGPESAEKPKKKKKRRKCRPHEDEEEHNCQRGPQSLRKRGGGPKQRCRELQQQQIASGAEVVTQCGPKKGPGGGGGGPKKHNNNKKGNKNAARGPNHNNSRNFLDGDGPGPNNRRGKKLGPAHGRQGAAGKNGGMQRPGGGGGGGGANKKRPKNQNGGKAKKQHTTTTTTTTTTSTVRPSSFAMETTTAMPTTTVYDRLDQRAESTSDRGDREQRNVHFSNSMEEADESTDDSGEDADEDENDEESDADADGDYDDEASMTGSSRGTPVGGGGESYTQLLGAGSEDSLYYDHLDF